MLGAAGTAPALADKIQLTNGRVLEGTIDRRAERGKPGATVTIALESGSIVVPAREVASVTPSTPTERAMLRARGAIEAGRYDAAVGLMDEALVTGGSPNDVAALLLDGGPALAANVALLRPETRARLAALIDAVAKTPVAERPEMAFVRLWLWLALGQDAKAAPLFQVLPPGWLASHRDRRRALGDWLGRRIDAAVAARDDAQAESLLGHLAKIDPAAAADRRVQFYLQWGRRLRASGDQEGALRIYADKLFPVAPQVAQEFVRRALEEAERSIDQGRGGQEVIALYERYGMPILPDDSRKRLVQLWRNEGWRALRTGKLDQARADFVRANGLQPGSADQDLTRLEFEGMQKATPKGDPIRVYELGVWANNHGLDEEALAAFRASVASPIVGSNAKAYIGQVMNRLAEKELKRLMDLYDAGRHEDVLAGVDDFLRQGYDSGYNRQAAQLNALTLNAMQAVIAERPQQAQALYQQAERAFYQEHYDEARQKAQTVMDHFKDTIVYPQARNLYARVHERQAFSRLEQGYGPAPTPKSDIINGKAEAGAILNPVLDRLTSGSLAIVSPLGLAGSVYNPLTAPGKADEETTRTTEATGTATTTAKPAGATTATTTAKPAGTPQNPAKGTHAP
jgi:tetratricopeptide (TPR) repeat protein